MKFQSRRASIVLAATVLASLLAIHPAQAQDYPTRTIKIIVPFAAGGGGDAIGRLVARKLEDQFKQPVIVENKPGASSIIATDLVAKAPADGYTILLNVPLIVQTVSLFNKLPYDPLADFAPVTLLGTTNVMLAVGTGKVSATTMKEFVEQARQKPKEHSYASIGPGSTGHLLGFALNEANRLDTLHIPYKGAAPATQALLSGEVSSVFLDYVTLKPHVDAGKVRLLAITGTERSAQTPTVPTLAELGYNGFESGSWAGLFVPAKTPSPILKRLEEALAKVLTDPEYVQIMTNYGYKIEVLSQPKFAAMVRSEFTRWNDLIKKAGIKLD
jgi:tripartite-type tricarboxylate transporter receptor subunit TctC